MKNQLMMRSEPERPALHNPRPAGVIRPGSGSDVLLRYLRQHPARWFEHCELVLALGRSKGEVDWALQYLALNGYVKSKEVERIGRKPAHCYRLGAGSTEDGVGYRELRCRRKGP